MHIFLDLDGVIANFSKGACKRLKIEYPKQTVFDDYDSLFNTIPKGLFYTMCRGHEFWAQLELFSYAKDMVNMVDRVSEGNWNFLTKPMIDPGCYSGKCEWIQTHFSKHINRLIIVNGPKSVCCKGPNDVLIDDAPKNIVDWAAAGGWPIRWKEKTDDFAPELYKGKIDMLSFLLTERKDPIQI